ncbi:biosynthetic peptidoglycan transglycosylase [Polyangium jinanense]|uniref:Transglycosylase domain-containing protein n=1 Tax=Polyangium jinanense TaxID=2829994 RepID=A0A9X4AS57_9BACT|nr:biosynthetic peptidoglycan transglycosylase [Polyangium jinanense]MDC3957390.1 transglycosylase domain-containing protein [Polyangium jinanense]MDC3982793.1 transglycosylase domain-containing protein [Polyangium jinanense]
MSFGPIVRHEAARAAERYGAVVAIDEVRPSLHGVKLRGVEVSLPEVPSAHVRFETIDVALGWSGKKIALQGGDVSAVGPREVVLREAEQWQKRYLARSSAGGGESSSSGGTDAAFEGLRIAWQDRRDVPTESVRASDVSFARQEGKVGLSAAEATITVGPVSVAVQGGHLTLIKQPEGGYRVAALSARSLDATLTLPTPLEEAKPVEGASATANEPSPRGPRDPAPKQTKTSPRGAAVRAQLVRGATLLDTVLEQGAKVELDSLHAQVRRGRDTLNLGPGSLVVRRDAGRMLVELSPRAHAEKEEQALTFSLSVPFGEAGGEIVADVKGGPLYLSTLGIRDGDFGLFDVAKTSLTTRSHLVLSADGKQLRVDGDGRVQNLSLRSDALSDEPIAGLELAFRLRGETALDGSTLRVDEGEVDLGAVRLLAHGRYDRVGEGHRVRAEFDVPLTACQSILDAAPRGLVPRIAGMRMAGSLAVKGHARFDTARLDRDFDVAWDLSNTCRITEVPPEIDAARWRKPFRRSVLGPAGERVEIESGPGTPGWVPYSVISRFMETAVLTTEDSGFRRHSGFDNEAIRNSIRENLRKGRFVRGASTLSMQLAKNLYLDRVKSLSRKLQEAVLTTYLEQELTKEQILELYLNVVEFGPMIYGIGPAARYYFNTSAGDLSLGQALYISSILPNPKQQHFAIGGSVSPGWMNYLRKLMDVAHRRKWISDEELEEGMRETVVRGQPAPERAARSQEPSGSEGAPSGEGSGEPPEPPTPPED